MALWPQHLESQIMPFGFNPWLPVKETKDFFWSETNNGRGGSVIGTYGGVGTD